MQDCPVCLAEMHSSRSGIHFMPCGHAMHFKCFQEYTKSNIACPMCKKSVCDPKYFEQFYDMQVASMLMPEEYRKQKMVIMCNDCLDKSEVPFHIMPGKCKKCRSYNTTRVDDPVITQQVYEA